MVNTRDRKETLVHQSPAPTLLPRGGGAGREGSLRRRGERQLLVLDTNVVEALLRSLGAQRELVK